MSLQPLPQRGDQTRDALIAAAIRIFGRDGFEAASTRAIAEAAGANQALIGYHFGSKEGLYHAVFGHIVEQIRGRVGGVVEKVETLLASPLEEPDPKAREARYLPPLLDLLEGFASLMAHEDSAAWAQLILREHQSPTPAFDVIYEGFMGPTLALLTRLVMALRMDSDETAARLLVVSLMGQAVVFRAARTGVLRHLGWSRIGPAELSTLVTQLRRNVTAQVLNPGAAP